ncbi:MAG TPA: NAD kinase [Mycobacteriales bacterium]|nr:NAD kinase [Mycobacteriales bacterium]
MTGTGERSVLLVTHTGRNEAVDLVRRIAERLHAAGVTVRALDDEAGALEQVVGSLPLQAVQHLGAAEDVELVLVLGGDGTLLRAAELGRESGTPLLGVNLGHVGFLAEAEPDVADTVVDAVLAGTWTVDERGTVDVAVSVDGQAIFHGWALNEVSLEKSDRARMVECALGIDGRPLVTFAADGVLVSTATGSTAYAFSAGGPVIWPDVDAMLVVPLAAHALFARPLVVSPSSVVAIEVLAGESAAMLACDGRRTVAVPAHARVEVTGGSRTVRLARIQDAAFTDRLVRKFGLPVHGWRGRNGRRT